jgi:hypothetical protein
VPRSRLLSIAIFLFCLLIASGCGYLIHWKLGQESLSAWGNFLLGAATIGLALVAWIGGLLAFEEYAERTKAEQIRWLAELFSRLFQDKLYRRMRQKVDYDDLDDIAELLEKNKQAGAEFSQEERDLLDEFTDYLNFFEMMAFLSKSGKIKVEDVAQIFDYYLRRFGEIKQQKAIMEYLEKDGFENLRQLLVEFKRIVSTGK